MESTRNSAVWSAMFFRRKVTWPKKRWPSSALSGSPSKRCRNAPTFCEDSPTRPPTWAKPLDTARRPARPFLIVGVGASAGGMDAFIHILRNLPTDIHAAFIFVCHLDPHHESSLADIFQRESKLQVTTVTDAVPVKLGHVYILPPNKQLRLSGGLLRTD